LARRRILQSAAISVLAAVVGTVAAAAAVHIGDGAARQAGNPFARAKLYVDHDSPAWWAMLNARDAGNAKRAELFGRIARHSWASWFGDWSNGHGSLYADVKARVDEITAAGSLPVLVAYDLPGRDCNGYSSGGAASPAAYRAWIRELARGIGDRRTVVVLEPDAVAELDCFPPQRRTRTLALVREAVQTLAALPHTAVYVDAGNEAWQPAPVIATRLREAGIRWARGFSLNVSNFFSTVTEERYGDRISSLLGGKPFVIDTSRNGRGAAPHDAWCNPPGRGLGVPFARPKNTHVDALLWIKAPGESDGTCRGGPRAGVWWPRYALGLAERARLR
jgi:endoglucanase